MIEIKCDQRSEEWFKERAGVITASMFRDAIEKTAKGLTSAKSKAYAAKLAIEKISGKSIHDGYESWQMRRGTELEEAARDQYEFETGNIVETGGVIITDDKLFGYSADGYIDDQGLIEIKCPSSPEKVIELYSTMDVHEYMHQIQGGLWLTKRKWCDLVIYTPQLSTIGKKIFIKRIERDEIFIEYLGKELIEFSKEIDRIVFFLKN